MTVGVGGDDGAERHDRTGMMAVDALEAFGLIKPIGWLEGALKKTRGRKMTHLVRWIYRGVKTNQDGQKSGERLSTKNQENT